MSHPHRPPERRILSLWLPTFATDRLGRRAAAGTPDAETTPLVTIRPDGGGVRLAAVDRAAAAAGLMPGMTLADARALVPPLRTAEAAPLREARDLARLVDWCGRYTPLAAADGTDGIWLDVTGCAHLFGGERALLDDLAGRLAGLGFAVRAAVAETPGAAWAIARHAGHDRRLATVPAGESAAWLADLPVAALRLPPAIVDGLAQLGLDRIGDLAGRPRAPLAARFGSILTRRLDEASGARFEPIDAAAPVPPCRLRLALPEPIVAAEDLTLAARRLVDALCDRLGRDRQGVRRLELAFYCADGTVRRADIGTSRPVRDVGHLMRLLAEPLANVDPGPGAEIVVLAAPRLERLAPTQFVLPEAETEARPADPVAIGRLVDRLARRLGDRNVVRLEPRASHVPERAVRPVPALAAASRSRDDTGERPAMPRGRRPVRLYDRPEPIEATALVPDHPPVMLRRGRTMHRVRRADGPERIAPEWWHDNADPEAATRDYYCLEDDGGRRWWVYREGLYTDRAPAPRWYLHGSFA